MSTIDLRATELALPSIAQLRQRLHDTPTLATAQFVINTLRQFPTASTRPVVRLAILRSFTIEPVIPFLCAGAALDGVEARVQVSDFNTYAQDILNPGSSLYSFAPDIVLLALQTRDALPRVWSRWTDDPRAAEQDAEDLVESLSSLVARLREQMSARVLIQGFEQPTWTSAGALDAQASRGQAATIESVNRSLRRFAEEMAAVDFIDYDALVARHGRLRWHDEGKFLSTRMPLAADRLPDLANEYLRFLLPALGRARKVLVVDLDNTLWGGVVGEVGPEGIQLDDEYPGGAYRHLQRAVLDLHARGVLLAINSRNNPADAAEVLERHPGMLLRPAHFSSVRINWQDKAQNMREIADELGLGLDSFAFLDDNPRERELIRQELPDVYVISLPDHPMEYADALRELPVFERVAFSDEDRDRGRLYAEERKRTESRSASTSLEDFYRSLGMAVRIVPAESQTLSRIAQLTQKTNQFNLTTRRYNEQQIGGLAADPGVQVRGLHATDRFGDNGLVGVAIVRLAGEIAEIDTFLLSCRVIGRTIETAFLAQVAADARVARACKLRGWYRKTAKNALVRELYRDHGFTLVDSRDGDSLWELDLAQGAPVAPAWITVTSS